MKTWLGLFVFIYILYQFKVCFQSSNLKIFGHLTLLRRPSDQRLRLGSAGGGAVGLQAQDQLEKFIIFC
jgi:hypothetical protein